MPLHPSFSFLWFGVLPKRKTQRYIFDKQYSIINEQKFNLIFPLRSIIWIALNVNRQEVDLTIQKRRSLQMDPISTCMRAYKCTLSR